MTSWDVANFDLRYRIGHDWQDLCRVHCNIFESFQAIFMLFLVENDAPVAYLDGRDMVGRMYVQNL